MRKPQASLFRKPPIREAALTRAIQSARIMTGVTVIIKRRMVLRIRRRILFRNCAFLFYRKGHLTMKAGASFRSRSLFKRVGIKPARSWYGK